MKKLIALLLALAMVLTLGACGNDNTPNNSSEPDVSKPVDSTPVSSTPVDDETEPTGYEGLDWDAIDAMDYEDMSDTIYDWNLGEFYDYYTVAKQELDDIDMRTALMAIAEAKMLESGVFAPIYGDGGAYAFSAVVPRTVTTTSWGADSDRYIGVLVADKLIKNTDRNALIALWSEAPDAATYYTQAKAYLEENGYGLKDTYNTYKGDTMETWDTIASSYASDGQLIAPTVSGLLAYDAKDVAQPELAESYEVSADGLVYTFHIRKGVKWVDQQGREIADVTANDWVTSMMHVSDNNDALGYLMSTTDGCGIKNYDAYINGEVTFDQVGVKAIDDYTLEYTLEAKFPAFATMMGYGCFMPLNYDFYKSQGGTFGAEGDEYDPGNYGTGPDTIAYCGPYLVTNYTPENIWTYSANPTYWNADLVSVKTINFYYNDGSDTLRIYNNVKDGTWDSGGLNANALVLAKEEIPEGEDQPYFDLYNYTTTNSATTYVAWLNLNRGIFHDFNDENSGVSPKTEEDIARTRVAMNNQHFRLALAFGFDRGAYNAVGVGEDLKYASLKNSYVTGAFAKLNDHDVTVDINGTSTTFPVGTYYGEILQAQLDADGYPIKVWDPTADGGAGSGDGFDGWYNVDNARAELQKAIDELAQIGVEITAENPIYIDSFYYTASENNTNMKQAYKQGLEAALEGKVVVNLIPYDDNVQMTYAYYRNSTGAEANFDISHNSGWGPDYGDPQSFLDTIQPYGYMCKNLGIY